MDIDALVQEVCAGPRYRGIRPELVRLFAEDELRRGRTGKELVKAVRNRLHQSVTAYFPSAPRYARWLESLEEAEAKGHEALQRAAFELMRHHASTAERLAQFETFLTLLRALGPIASVLDLGCGLQPLAAPSWLPAGAHYEAIDADARLAAFLGRFFHLAGIGGTARAENLLNFESAKRYDVALLLKLLPVLAQADESAPARLLRAVPAERLLISFPLRSLGGREVGMQRTYSEFFEKLAEKEGFVWEMQTIGDELIYLARRRS